MPVERDHLEMEKRQAQLRHARAQLKKCLEVLDYSGAAIAKAQITALTEDEPGSHRVAESDDSVVGRRPSAKGALKGELMSIENLIARFPQVCSPVRLEGVTLLSIGKVSEPPYTDKGKGPGKGQSKGKKGKKGKGRLEAGTQIVQPVYFGDDTGKVICTLATGEDVKRIPVTLPQNAYVDISSLMTQAGQLGVLHWTDSTQVSLRWRPRHSGCNYMFPYDVMSDYSKDFASMAFAQQCAVGTYVAIAMRITDVRTRWTSTDQPYLEVMGFDTEGVGVGPLRIWLHEEGDIRLGGAYLVRGLKVENDGSWNSAKGVWIRCAGTAKAIGCSVRTALEDVSGVESITQYL